MSFKNLYNGLVEKIAAGGDPAVLVENEIVAQSNSFKDRSDDLSTPEAKASEFERIAREFQGALPNVGPDWISTIADQVRASFPDGMAELKRMVYDNREQYAGSARVDAGGSFQTWDAALHGLHAVMTDQIPPSAPGAIS